MTSLKRSRDEHSDSDSDNDSDNVSDNVRDGDSCDDDSDDEEDDGWEWSFGHDYDGNAFRVFMDDDIVYRLEGFNSVDICAGVQANWTQRHNPFLFRKTVTGKPLGGIWPQNYGDGFVSARIFDCVSAHFIKWTAERRGKNTVYISENKKDQTCTLFQFFKSSTIYEATKTPAEMFSKLSLGIFGADASVVAIHDGIPFRVRHKALCCTCNVTAFKNSRYDRFVYLTLPLTRLFGNGRAARVCCEAHRTFDHVLQTLDSRAPILKLKRPAWFYSPLAWFSVACGFCKEQISIFEDGHYFEKSIPSEFRRFRKMIDDSETDSDLCSRIPEQLAAIKRRDDTLFTRVCPLLMSTPFSMVSKYSKDCDFLFAIARVLPYDTRCNFYESILWLVNTRSCDIIVQTIRKLLWHYKQREDVIRVCVGQKLCDAVNVILAYDQAPGSGQDVFLEIARESFLPSPPSLEIFSAKYRQSLLECFGMARVMARYVGKLDFVPVIGL